MTTKTVKEITEMLGKRNANKTVKNYLLSVRVTKEKRDAFKAACGKNGSTVSETLLAFVDEYLKEYGD